MKPAACSCLKPATDYFMQTAKHSDRKNHPCQELLRRYETGFEATDKKLIGGVSRWPALG